MPLPKNTVTLWDVLDISIADNKRPPNNAEVSLYPSEASAVAIDSQGNSVILGKCMRAQWMRNKLQRQEKDKNHQALFPILKDGFEADTLWMFETGNAIEDIITKQARKAGILVDNSRKFEWPLPWVDPTTDRPLIRGEIDIVLDLMQVMPTGIEAKSFAGYNNAKKILDRFTWGRLVRGTPKEGQLLQGIVYAYLFCVLLKELSGFQMAYMDRDKGKRNAFVITFREEETQTETGVVVKNRVMIDGEEYEYKLYAEDLIDRYLSLHWYIVNNVVPNREFEIQYSDERIKHLYEQDELPKGQRADYEKGKRVIRGDFNCNYCSYVENCYTYDEEYEIYTPIQYVDGVPVVVAPTVEQEEPEELEIQEDRWLVTELSVETATETNEAE